MIPRAAAAIVLAASTILAGCRASAPAGPRPPAVRDPYADGLARFRLGRYVEASAAFEEFLRIAPGGPDEEAARYYLAIARARAGACDASVRAAGALATRHPGGALAVEARLAASACRPQEGPLDVAGATERLDDALAAGDVVRALAAASRLMEAGGEPTPERREAVEGLVARASAAAADAAWPLVANALWPGGALALRRIELAAHVGDLDRARRLLADLRGDGARLARARALVAALEERDARVAADAIGVLLPLSGRYAAVGRELRAAIELAAAAEPAARLVYVDTAGEDARAAAAVDELAVGARPVLLLGPVGEREAAAAAERAAALGIPIGLLSPAEGLADPASGVVRLVGSAEDRAAAAARIAVALGHDRPAVLAPRDDAGRREAAAFAEAARAAGGQVVVVAYYDPTGTDLEPDLKALLGLDPRRNERLRRHLARDRREGWKTFSPDVDFDLLFVPDGHERAALVASFLVYYNVELRTGEDVDVAYLRRKHRGRLPTLVQLMGGPGWHHPGLFPRGGEAVEGALLVDVFAGGEAEEYASEGAADFAARFAARHGRAPSAAAAEAHDAVRLALGAWRRARDAGGPPREAMARALAAAAIAEGACGPARIGPDGELAREVLLLGVEGGAFVLQDPVD